MPAVPAAILVLSLEGGLKWSRVPFPRLGLPSNFWRLIQFGVRKRDVEASSVCELRPRLRASPVAPRRQELLQ